MRAFAVPYAMILLGTSTVGVAQAVAPDRAAIVQTYANMCATQSINMPTPFGESDLKDNPKLTPYCQCFAGKFADRAIQRSKNAGPPPPLKQSTAEERVMRNDCRQQLGLPALKFSQ